MLMLSTAAVLALGTGPSRGQSSPPTAVTESAERTDSGHVWTDGHSAPYLIRRLPVSSFPDLPSEIAERLNERGCMIPQTYEAHRPENVIRASLQRAGSSDWAVLCADERAGLAAGFFWELAG